MRSAIVAAAVVAVALLMVPLVAMQLSDEVEWGLEDFVVAGALLFAAGVAYALVARRRETVIHRVVAGVVIGAVLVLVWASLAV